MSTLLMAAALLIAADEHSPAEAPSVDADIVQCRAEKQPEQIAKVRDAESQDAYMAAFRVGLEMCPVDTTKLSMGHLFDALNAHGKSDEEAGE